MSILVYIKPEKMTEVYDRKVCLKQVAQIRCRDPKLEKQCSQLTILSIQSPKEDRYVISTIDVVKKIQTLHPEAEVVNLGVADFIVGYQPHPRSLGRMQWIKTALVCLIVFFGGAFAIMTFNNDGSVSQIFQDVDRLVLGSEKTDSLIPASQSGDSSKSIGVWILEVSYSVGLVLGVTLFFNHFGKKKITLDPTPIEVQMRLYEDQVGTTVIQNASRAESGVDPQ